MITSVCPFNFPSFFSTVTPGQFPTVWFEPVKALNKVVLPVFGFPVSAILIAILAPYLFISIFSASSFLIESSYPLTVTSIGSPRGATLRT